MDAKHVRQPTILARADNLPIQSHNETFNKTGIERWPSAVIMLCVSHRV